MMGIPRGFTQVNWSIYQRTEVIAVKTLLMVQVWDGGNCEQNSQDGVDCIDLDVVGRRWEGGVKDGKPFGYEVLNYEYYIYYVLGRKAASIPRVHMLLS